MEDGAQILIAGALLAGGIAASLVAGRLRVPGLLLFLGLGMVIGSDGLSLIDFGATKDDFELARSVGIVALALILFEGGLAAGWNEIRPVIAPSLALALLGTLGTAAIVGLAAGGLLDLNTTEGLLLGSIVAATDSAAIFSVLRGSSLNRRLARTLEGESGFNDPVAIVLVLGLIEALTDPPHGAGAIALEAVIELSIGLAIGLTIGWLAGRAFQNAKFSTPGLYPVASIATAAVSFGAADTLHGSGFLAVYITGLVLGTMPIPARRTIDDFHDGVAWVSQIAVFVTFGLLVDPGEFGDIAGEALLIAGVLMFVARPLAALVATVPLGFSVREATLVGWAGLRGAVPIVLATFAVIENVDRSGDFFNIVFFVVLTSTLVQGASFAPLARALGVTGNEPEPTRPLMEIGTIRQLGAEVVEFPVRARRRGRGAPRQRAGAPPRRPRQRDRPRRRGAAAARVDRDRRRRPAAHPRPRRGPQGGGGPVRALARWPARPAEGDGPRADRTGADLQRQAVARRARRRRRARGDRRHRRRADAPDAARRPRRARCARGRAARRDRRRAGRLRRIAAARPLEPRAHRQGSEPRGARLVAGGRRRRFAGRDGVLRR